MQFPVVLPGDVAAGGVRGGAGAPGGCAGGRDPDGVVWLHADLPLTPGKDGVLWSLAHEAKHAQTFLRPGAPTRRWVRAARGLRGAVLRGPTAEGRLRPGIRVTPPKPKCRRTCGGRGTDWRIPYQYE